MLRSRARHAFTFTVVIAALVAATQTAAGQTKPEGPRFTQGYTDIGPAVGLGNIGNAGASFGARFERAVKPLPDLGDGTLGIQVGFDFYSYSSRFTNYSWKYKYVPIGVTANYHFKLEDDPKVDPFLGIGLGYSAMSCSLTGVATVTECPYSSGIYFIGRVGARYFLAQRMALYADVGAGATTFNVGFMLKVK